MSQKRKWSFCKWYFWVLRLHRIHQNLYSRNSYGTYINCFRIDRRTRTPKSKHLSRNKLNFMLIFPYTWNRLWFNQLKRVPTLAMAEVCRPMEMFTDNNLYNAARSQYSTYCILQCMLLYAQLQSLFEKLHLTHLYNAYER